MCQFTRIHWICGHVSLIREIDNGCVVRDSQGIVIGCSLPLHLQFESQTNPGRCYEDLPCSFSNCRLDHISRRMAGYHVAGQRILPRVNTEVLVQAIIDHKQWIQAHPDINPAEFILEQCLPTITVAPQPPQAPLQLEPVIPASLRPSLHRSLLILHQPVAARPTLATTVQEWQELVEPRSALPQLLHPMSMETYHQPPAQLRPPLPSFEAFDTQGEPAPLDTMFFSPSAPQQPEITDLTQQMGYTDFMDLDPA